MTENIKIGLSLSGGGIRAVAFHCGVLSWLAENNKLEDIHHISSVSGGSLLTGLIFSLNNQKWPTSKIFLDNIEPKIQDILIKINLQRRASLNLFNPLNWNFILSRANLLSKTIQEEWQINFLLDQLPESPTWSVNGTTAETGKRFSFKNTKCGDYKIGYTDAHNFQGSDVMALSAAFPLAIGPFTIKASNFKWQDRDKNDINISFPKLHIYDGGIYDNLGLEPLFDVGSREFKGDVNHIIISDAGFPFKPTILASMFNTKKRIERIMDIALDQAHSLRIRSLVNYLQQHPNNGSFILIGSNAKEKIDQYKNRNPQIAKDLLSDQWQSQEKVQAASSYPTDLKILTEKKYKLLKQHGYETAKWNMLLFPTRR